MEGRTMKPLEEMYLHEIIDLLGDIREELRCRVTTTSSMVQKLAYGEAGDHLQDAIEELKA